MPYYLVFTKPKEELKVVKNLTEGKINCYLPLLKKTTIRRNAVFTVIEPLFPRYIFVETELEKNYHKIKYTRGVGGFIDFGSGPVEVEPEIVKHIRDRERDGFIHMVNKKRRFTRNERIAIKRGMFKDLEVVFEGYLSGDERVTLLLNSVSANIKLNIPKYYL